jgi:hypothetical protein
VSLVLGRQGVDDVTQGAEGLVDVLRLLEPLARRVRLGQALRACKARRRGKSGGPGYAEKEGK